MDFLDFYHVNDRRAHRRFAVAMSARLYHANGHFSPCSTADLSLAGASIYLTSARPEPVTGFGCDETGKLRVARFHFTKPFVRLMFETTTETRTVIKRALRTLSDRQMIQPLPLRRGERLITRNVVLSRADGSHILCDILDMSPQGMLLGCDARPPLGERIIVGKVAGFVARHHSNGFAIRIHERTPVNNVVGFPVAYRQPLSTPSSSFDDLA